MNTNHQDARACREDPDDAAFERELRSGLAALAADAPAGPSAQRVLAALRHRTLLRRAFAGAGALAAAAMLALVVILQHAPHASQDAVAIDPAISLAAVDHGRPDRRIGKRHRAADDHRHAIAPAAAASAADAPDAPDAAAGWQLSLAAAPVSAPPAPEPADWDLSLSLSLAAHIGDQPWPLINISSPW